MSVRHCDWCCYMEFLWIGHIVGAFLFKLPLSLQRLMHESATRSAAVVHRLPAARLPRVAPARHELW